MIFKVTPWYFKKVIDPLKLGQMNQNILSLPRKKQHQKRSTTLLFSQNLFMRILCFFTWRPQNIYHIVGQKDWKWVKKWNFAFSSKSVLYIFCSVIFLDWRLRNRNIKKPTSLLFTWKFLFTHIEGKKGKKEAKSDTSVFFTKHDFTDFFVQRRNVNTEKVILRVLYTEINNFGPKMILFSFS